MNRDIAFSGVLFLLSALGTLISYNHVKSISEHDQSVHISIMSGSHDYYIANGDLCVGEISYKLLDQNQIVEFKSEGRVNISYLERFLPLNFNTDISFNSIGQLIGAVFRVDLQEKSAVFGATNIDPINLSFKTNLLEKEFTYKWNIDGPVEIRKVADGYRLSGARLAGPVAGFSPANLLKSAGTPLRLIPAKEAEKLCGKGSIESWDVTEIINKLKSNLAITSGL